MTAFAMIFPLADIPDSTQFQSSSPRAESSHVSVPDLTIASFTPAKPGNHRCFIGC